MKVLIAYDSRTGHTEKMAEYMAEGVRFPGHEVETKKIPRSKMRQLYRVMMPIFSAPPPTTGILPKG